MLQNHENFHVFLLFTTDVFLWSHAPTRAENSPPGCFWSLLKCQKLKEGHTSSIFLHPSSDVVVGVPPKTWDTKSRCFRASSSHAWKSSRGNDLTPGQGPQGPRTPELNWLQDSRASWGWVLSFYGIRLTWDMKFLKNSTTKKKAVGKKPA